ncbi:MAG: hypothetical protein HOP02_04240 [Methylococcaceae bacterium]|nr:hypothetical protein [Methylococcaceae bacterium]
MKKLLTIIFLSYVCSLVMGCSNVNETLWQSLKLRDDIVNPTTEAKKTSDKPESYQDYKKERDAILKDSVKK